MTRDDRMGLLYAIVFILLTGTLVVSCNAQTFVPSDLHPNFSAETRNYLSADNDCAVIAYAIAADVPYHRAHRLFTKCRPTAQDAVPLGCLVENWTYFMEQTNRMYLFQSYHDIPCTVAEFARANVEGNFFIMVEGHALAICDGTVYDNLSNVAMDAEVLGAIYIIDPLD